MFSHPFPSRCADCRGTCNLVTGECSCPFTHAGPHCDEPLLAGCSLDAAAASTTLRPLFWLHQVTRPAWRRSAAAAPTALGPLPCACVEQMLALGAPFRSKWTSLPLTYLCATSAPTLAELQRAPARAQWANLTARFADASYAFSRRPIEHAAAAAAWSERLRGQLRPRSQCAGGCGGAGWCTSADRGAPPSCVCFPEAVRDGAGGCALVTRLCGERAAARAGGGGGGGRDAAASHEHPPPPPLRLCAAAVGGGGGGGSGSGSGSGSGGGHRGGGGSGSPSPPPQRHSLPLVEASGGSVSFNAVRCPRDCAGRGACDQHGQSRRLGGAVAGHHGLIRLNLKAWGGPPHSRGEAQQLRSLRETVTLQPVAAPS